MTVDVASALSPALDVHRGLMRLLADLDRLDLLFGMPDLDADHAADQLPQVA